MLCTLGVLGFLPQPQTLERMVGAALDIGLAPRTILECFMQSGLYAGYITTKTAAGIAHKVFEARGVAAPEEPARTDSNEELDRRGIKLMNQLRRAFEGKDAVVHLAAIPNPRTAPADVTFQTNVQGAWSVLQAAENAGVKRVVVASSDSVFGLSYNPPDWPPQFLPVDETHPVRPTEFYSLSKHVTETIAQSFMRTIHWPPSSIF